MHSKLTWNKEEKLSQNHVIVHVVLYKNLFYKNYDWLKI